MTPTLQLAKSHFYLDSGPPQDIQAAVVFLCTRVKITDTDN